MQNDYQFAPPVEGVAGGGTGYGWNDANLQNMGGPILRVIDPTRQPTSDLVHVWCMPSTATIQHQEQPRPLDQISMLVARNERESVQLALRPKVSWASGGAAGYVKVDCTDICSCSGEKLEVGKAVTVRRVVPMLGIPDALVPLDLPGAKVSLLPGETSALWISIHVPVSQPPGVYEGEISILAMQADADMGKYVKETEKDNLKGELQNLLPITEAGEDSSLQTFREALEAVGAGLKQVIGSPFFSTNQLENEKMEIDGEADNNLKVTVKLRLTVWDFVLPLTPSIPAVIGISETVIEDRFGVEHGSEGWYEALDVHFFWLLQYRISPYFCRWGGNMRVLAYTCPWPVNHPKADEYFSDERLAAYAVPYYPVLESSAASKEAVKRELEILRTKPHWKKSYFYLWDEPVRLEQYETIRGMSSDIKETAPDARVLTTYYCGPCDSTFEHGSFEALVKVPSFLRPHTQIFCTSEWALGNSEALVKDILAEIKHENNEEWWTYVCLGPTDPHPNFHLGMRGTQQRAVMWRVWKEGGTGFLYWGANCYEKAIAPSAEIRFRRGLPPGDGVLFYPGEVFTPGNSTPVASARLERLLSGLQDFEYLQLYSSQYGRHAGLSLLERTGVYLGPEQYTHDHGHIDAFRAEVFNSYQPH